MKKMLLVVAIALTSLGTAVAHPMRVTHYHDQGRVVIGNTIAPKVAVTYETDRFDRRIRVTTTTKCVDTRVNRRNNHIRCLEEETSVRRELDNQGTPGMPRIEPVIYRTVERDAQGRRVIVTTTFTCVRSGYDDRTPVCYQWRRDESREYVRRDRDYRNYDLNGDGRSDPWERLLYQGFREVLEDN